MRRLALGLIPLAIAVGVALALGLGELRGPQPTAQVLVPPSPVVGVLVEVDSAGLADVRGFVLRLSDGALIHFELGPLENGAQFAPGHLAEHLATSDPIRAYFRVEGGRAVVYRLEDASAPAAT